MALPHERPAKKKKKKPSGAGPGPGGPSLAPEPRRKDEKPARRGDINPDKPGQQAQGQRQAPKRPSPTRRPEPEPRKAKKRAKKPIQGKPPPRRRRRHDTPGPGGPSLVGPKGVTPTPGRVPRAPRDNQGPGPGVGHAPPSSRVGGGHVPNLPGLAPGNVNTISIQRAIKAEGHHIKVDGKHGGRSQRALEIRARAVGQRQRNRNQEQIEDQRVYNRPGPGDVVTPTTRHWREQAGEVYRYPPEVRERRDPRLWDSPGLDPRRSRGAILEAQRIMRRSVREGQRRVQSAAYLRTMAHAQHVWLGHTRFNNPENAARARPADVRAYFFDPEFGRWGEGRPGVTGERVAADIRGANLMRAYLRAQGHKKTVKARGRWDDKLQDAIKAEMREWVRVERRQAIRKIEKLFFDSGIIRPPSARDQQLLYLPFSHGYIDLDDLTPKTLHDILDHESPLSRLLMRELMGRLRTQRDARALAMQAGFLTSGQRVDSARIATMIRLERVARMDAERDEPWWQFTLDAFNASMSVVSEATEIWERGWHAAGTVVSSAGFFGVGRATRNSGPLGGGAVGGAELFWHYYDQSDRIIDEFDEKHPWWGLGIDVIADPLNFIPPAWIAKPFQWTGRGVKLSALTGERAAQAARATVSDARFLPDRLDAVARLPGVPYHAGMWSAAKADQFWSTAAPWLKQAPAIRHGYKFVEAATKLKDDALEQARKQGQLKMIEHVIKRGKGMGMNQARHRAAKRMKITIGEYKQFENDRNAMMRELLPTDGNPAIPGLSDDLVRWLRENRAAVYAAEGTDVYSKVGGVLVGKFSSRLAGSEMNDMLHDQAWMTAFRLSERTEEAEAWVRKTRQAAEELGVDPDRPQVSRRFYAKAMRREVARLKKEHGGTIPFRVQKDMALRFHRAGGRFAEVNFKDFFARHGDTPTEAEWKGFLDQFETDLDQFSPDAVWEGRGGFKVGDPEFEEFVEKEFVRTLLKAPIYRGGQGDPRIRAMVNDRVKVMLEDMHADFMGEIQKLVNDGVAREELWDAEGKALINSREDVDELAEEVRAMFDREPLMMPNQNWNRKFSPRAKNDLVTSQLSEVNSRIEFQRRIDEATGIEIDPEKWNKILERDQRAVHASWIDCTNSTVAQGRAKIASHNATSGGPPITYQGRGWYDKRHLIEVEPEYALPLMDHMDLIRKHARTLGDDYDEEFVERLESAFAKFEPHQRSQFVVRGQDGRALTFHHGTTARFEKFSDEFLGSGLGQAMGKGHYFARTREVPKAIKRDWRAAGEDVRLVEVNLSYKKPLDANQKVDLAWLDKFTEYLKLEQRTKLLADDLKGLPGGAAANWEAGLADIREHIVLDISQGGMAKFGQGPYRVMDVLPFIPDPELVTRALQRMGYDAIEAVDRQSGWVTEVLDEVIVFSDTQIHKPEVFSATAGSMPSVDRIVDVYRGIYNTAKPVAFKPWGPDMARFYAKFDTTEDNFRASLKKYRQAADIMRRAEVVKSLKSQGAYWQALRHAQGKPWRALYFGLAGAMGVWRFFALAMNPGWVVRNMADNFVKVVLQGVVSPKAWWYEGLDGVIRSIFDVDVARMRDAMRFIDRVHGNMPRALDPNFRKAQTFEDRYLDAVTVGLADETSVVGSKLWEEGIKHGYTDDELLTMLHYRSGLGGPANPTLRSQNAAADWFDHTLETGFWSAPIKQIESVFKHYDIDMHPKLMEQLTMSWEGDRILPRFHPTNKGKVIPGRAPSKTVWGEDDKIVRQWRSHFGGIPMADLVKTGRVRRTLPSGHVIDSATGEILPMSPWETMRMGVDPSTGQYLGAWVARMHDNIWELFGSRPENIFRRVLYRDKYAKAMARHGDPFKAAQEGWESVEKTLFDYSKITVIEDNFRIFFPFVQFWRKNFQFWLRTFKEKPWFLVDLHMYQETLEEVHASQPPWMRRYISLKELSDIVARIPGLAWMAESLENAVIDPLNYLSFAPLYRAFKSTNPNLPPEEAGLGFLGGFIDALNEWGASMNPFIRKPLEWVGVLNFRSWQNVFPQTSLIDAFTRDKMSELFPNGLNLENWLSDAVLDALNKDTMTERTEEKFNYYVQLEMAGQAARGETVDREKAERKIRDFLYVKTLLGFFAGTYIRRMTPEDVHFSQLAYGMAMGQINHMDLTREEKLVYQLYKDRNFDIAQYDRYVEVLPLLRSYYRKGYDDAQQFLKIHPELLPFVSNKYGRVGVSRENIAQEIMLQQKNQDTFELFALIDATDIPYRVRQMGHELLTTPDLRDYWKRNDTKHELQLKMIKGQYHQRIQDLHRNYHAISDWDWEAKQEYLKQHPELERYWQAHGSASDDYRTILFSVESTLRDRYFEILNRGKKKTNDPDFDGAIAFLKQFPFIFDSTAKRRKYREIARVGHFPGYTPGGYARRGGGTWRDFGMSEHARDYLHARPFLDRFFNMLDRQGKGAAYDWLDGNSKGARIVRAYFDEYSKGGKVGSTPKARAYLKAKKALDHFFALPKGQRDKWLWGRSPQAKLVREYFRKYAKGGLKRFEDRPMSQHQKDYLEAKSALSLYFGMSEAERIKWLQGGSAEAELVRDYFDKYADERGQTEHSRDYAAIKPVLEQYFALPKGPERRAFLDAHPELEDYFAKYSDTDKTTRAFTQDPRGGQYLAPHWSYGHSKRYQGRGASRGGFRRARNPYLGSQDPQLRRRLEFWSIYFNLPPDERPQFVLDHADEYGVFVYGALGPQDVADKQSDLMAKAFAFARDGDRSLLYGLLQPLIDFYFSLEDPAERQMMLRGNPELQAYFDLTADPISTGDPVLDKLLEQYFKLPKGSRMRTIMLDQNPILKEFIEENYSAEDDALHALLEVYFTLSASEKRQYRIDHPELQEYFDKRSEEKDNEKMQLEAFDRADPRLKKYFDVAEDEITYAAWLRLQQMQHESLKDIAIQQRRDRRQEEQLPVMAY